MTHPSSLWPPHPPPTLPITPWTRCRWSAASPPSLPLRILCGIFAGKVGWKRFFLVHTCIMSCRIWEQFNGRKLAFMYVFFSSLFSLSFILSDLYSKTFSSMLSMLSMLCFNCFAPAIQAFNFNVKNLLNLYKKKINSSPKLLLSIYEMFHSLFIHWNVIIVTRIEHPLHALVCSLKLLCL